MASEEEGAEIAYGAEECYRRIVKLMQDLGFPRGLLPLKEIEEFGYVCRTGFAWMKQKTPYQHYFTETKTLVRYGIEVTAYMEKGRMKNISGVKSKQLFLWVPAVEMSIINGNKIDFKSPVGIGKSYPLTAFMTDEEKQMYMEKTNE
ncbi:hypothetical protein HAX54_048691 [Datura stramonium]|uniref:Uncharacterized protein n=1 Tax=Datura stramonium TaxID=4076 RepID=A0ABS8SUV9_DATST|nr:hypothetical protein [Datura stramonium]